MPMTDEEQLEFDRMKTARDSLLITNARLNSRLAERTWVGLTDEERNKLWRDVVGWGDPSHDDEDLMKALEAKLKEKNT